MNERENDKNNIRKKFEGRSRTTRLIRLSLMKRPNENYSVHFLFRFCLGIIFEYEKILKI